MQDGPQPSSHTRAKVAFGVIKKPAFGMAAFSVGVFAGEGDHSPFPWLAALFENAPDSYVEVLRRGVATLLRMTLDRKRFLPWQTPFGMTETILT
jgi:hypothetical protein